MTRDAWEKARERESKKDEQRNGTHLNTKRMRAQMRESCHEMRHTHTPALWKSFHFKITIDKTFLRGISCIANNKTCEKLNGKVAIKPKQSVSGAIAFGIIFNHKILWCRSFSSRQTHTHTEAQIYATHLDTNFTWYRTMDEWILWP